MPWFVLSGFPTSLSDAKETFQSQFTKEWVLLKIYWPWILLTAVIQYVHNIFHNTVFYIYDQNRLYQQPILHDLGFIAFNATEDSSWKPVTEVITFLFLSSIIIFAFSPFFYKRSREIFTVLMFYRFLSVMSIALMIRSGSFLFTILPAPSSHCQPNDELYMPPKNFVDILFKFDAINGCADLIFSSHTSYVIVCSFIYYKYGGIRMLKYFCFATVIVLGCLIVTLKKHYSVDVWLAWCIVPLIWDWFDLRFPDFVPAELSKDAHVHGDDADHDHQKDHQEQEMHISPGKSPGKRASDASSHEDAAYFSPGKKERVPSMV